MKKILLLSATVALAFFTKAQGTTLSPTVISTAGGYASAGNISLSYTVGETGLVQTFSSSSNNIILTQGFEQPLDAINGLLDIEKSLDGAFSVYPVPAQATLWFGYEFSEAGKVEINLYNVAGQKMGYTFNEGYSSGKQVHSFECSTYASGNYVLTVKYTSTTGQEKTLSKKVELVNL